MNVQFQTRTLNLLAFGLIVTQPVIFSAVGYFLSRAAGRTEIDFIHVIIGSGVMGLWSTSLFTSFYDLRSDRREGTLELIVGSPTTIFSVLSIRVFSNVLLGSLSFVLSLIVAFLIFDFSPPLSNLPHILLSLGILLFAFWCLGLLFAHLAAISRLHGTYLNYFELPIGLITGFMFPISLLPGWAQQLSALIPLSWAFNGLTSSIQQGVDPLQLTKTWIISIAISLAYLIIIIFMSKRVQNMIRVSGELSSV